jgi:hypothetical protein
MPEGGELGIELGLSRFCVAEDDQHRELLARVESTGPCAGVCQCGEMVTAAE